MISNRIIFLSVLSAIGVISASLCAPALPFIANHFQAQFFHIQFTISLFLMGNAFGQFLSGPLSDKFGQKTILLGGLCLYILASVSCAAANQMTLLLAARFFQGMGSSVGPVLSRAITINSYSADKAAQVQSYGAIGMGVASILAIFSSGHLTLVSWRGNFWLASGLGSLLLVWSFYTLKTLSLPTVSTLSLKNSFFRILPLFKNRSFLFPTTCHSLTYGLMYGYIGVFSFLLIEMFHETKPTQVGTYSAYMIACYMLGAFIASRLLKRFASHRLVIFGITLQLIAGIFLTLAPSPFFVLGALALFNMSIGIILPLTSANALTPFAQQSAGAASSALGLSYRFIGAMLSTTICLFPINYGHNLGFAIFFLSLGSLILMTMFSKRAAVTGSTKLHPFH